MSYSSSFGPSFGSSYPQQAPPPKRRGVKRTVFGVIGLIANGIGLVVMPIVAGLIAAVISIAGATELTPLGPAATRVTAEVGTLYTIGVPQADLETARCEITGSDLTVEPGEHSITTGELDGVTYYDLYDFTVATTQEVTVTCIGTDSVVLGEVGAVGTLIGVGVGLVLPVLGGLISLVLLIWGIIALVRSSGSR